MTKETRNDIIAFAVEKDLCERMDRWIAEKVMGWTPLIRQPRWLAWSPASSVTDAIYALEKWCDAGKGRTWKIVRLDNRAGYRVWLRPLIADQVADTLELAISRALCKATGMPG